MEGYKCDKCWKWFKGKPAVIMKAPHKDGSSFNLDLCLGCVIFMLELLKESHQSGYPNILVADTK